MQAKRDAVDVIYTVRDLIVAQQETQFISRRCVHGALYALPIGSVACPGGLSPAIVGGSENTGSSQTQTRTVTEAGISSADDLVVVLSASEGATSFTLTNLSLTIYAPSGTILFNSGNLGGAPINLDTSLAGPLGFAFVLDPLQVQLADPFISGAGAGSNRIGLAATLTSVDGGNETFFVADTSNVAINVPEPPMSLVIVTGIAIVGLVRARRRRFSTPTHKAS